MLIADYVLMRSCIAENVDLAFNAFDSTGVQCVYNLILVNGWQLTFRAKCWPVSL